MVPFPRLLSFSLYLTLLSFSTPGVSEPGQIVILISTPLTEEQMSRLSVSLDAHLSDFNAHSEIEMVDTIPSERSAQVAMASAIRREGTTLALVWICPSENALLLMVRGDGPSEQTLLQTISSLGEGGAISYDKLATLIRSLLTPWFEKYQSPAERETVIEITKVGELSAVPVSPKRDRHQIGLELAAAYTLTAVFEADSVLNGAELDVGIIPLKHLEFKIGVRLLQPAAMPVEGEEIRLVRVPILAGADVFISKMSFDVGITGALIIDISRVRGVDEALAPDDIRAARWGAALSGFVRYRFTPVFGAWLDIGVDLFTRPYHYRWDGQRVYTNGPVQLNGAMGISLFLPSRRP